jgi:hypothetical protein
MKEDAWWEKLLKPVGYIIGAYFLGGVIVLCAGALTELVDMKSTWIRIAIIYLGVGGTTWWLFRSHTDTDDV